MGGQVLSVRCGGGAVCLRVVDEMDGSFSVLYAVGISKKTLLAADPKHLALSDAVALLDGPEEALHARDLLTEFEVRFLAKRKGALDEPFLRYVHLGKSGKVLLTLFGEWEIIAGLEETRPSSGGCAFC